MSETSKITSALDRLARQGRHWIWQSRLGAGLRRVLPRTLAWLLLVPGMATVVLVLGWLAGEPWKLPTPWVLGLWPLPPLLHLGWHLARLWRHQPTRQEALAVYDEQLGLKDRLQTADQFLAFRRRSPFMQAAVLDAEPHLDRALHHSLVPDSAAGWNPSRRLAFAPLFALALMLLHLWLPPAARRATASSDLEPAPVELARSETVSLPETPAPPARSAEPRLPPDSPEPALVSPKPTPSPDQTAEPRKTAAPTPTPAGREKMSLGESRGGQTAQATSTGRSSQSRGMPGSQAPPSSQPQEPPKPKANSKKPQEKDESGQPRRNVEDKSGATAGRGSSSGSSRNPASTDWASKDRTEESDQEAFEDEQDVLDEETESEARGGLQPSLRDRRPPVNRDLSIGFGNRASQDANGRGGPGQRKKSRGVASLVLGVPVPDHVKGQPNPGRVKINQERVQPQPETVAIEPAEDRGRRSGPIGPVTERTLDTSMRQVVRDFFIKTRQTAAATGGDLSSSE